VTSDLSKTAVDTHFHVFAARPAQPGVRYAPSYDAPLAAWQRAAASCGVRRGVLVQTSFLGTDNRLLLSTLAQHGDTLRGIAVVAPDADPATLMPLHAAGVRGLRLNLSGISHQVPAWSAASGLWDALAALGWHLELHTDIGQLPGVLAQLPAALPLVIDHMGKPQAASAADATVRALARRATQAKVHVKLSGAYRLGAADAGALAQLWLGELGPRRLLWGSDWPCTNHEAQADYPALWRALEDWLDDAPVVLAARVENPQRLYWMPTDTDRSRFDTAA
jgi:predicted TIM-barrel fold metal-dependent hydrolase